MWNIKTNNNNFIVFDNVIISIECIFLSLKRLQKAWTEVHMFNMKRYRASYKMYLSQRLYTQITLQFCLFNSWLIQ
jgi:aromatic ring hydroxylase